MYLEDRGLVTLRNVPQPTRVAFEVARGVIDSSFDPRGAPELTNSAPRAYATPSRIRIGLASVRLAEASDLAVGKGIRTNFQNCPADDSRPDGTE
jgi:hypothetical protein